MKGLLIRVGGTIGHKQWRDVRKNNSGRRGRKHFGISVGRTRGSETLASDYFGLVSKYTLCVYLAADAFARLQNRDVCRL